MTEVSHEFVKTVYELNSRYRPKVWGLFWSCFFNPFKLYRIVRQWCEKSQEAEKAQMIAAFWQSLHDRCVELIEGQGAIVRDIVNSESRINWDRVHDRDDLQTIIPFTKQAVYAYGPEDISRMVADEAAGQIIKFCRDEGITRLAAKSSSVPVTKYEPGKGVPNMMMAIDELGRTYCVGPAKK